MVADVRSAVIHTLVGIVLCYHAVRPFTSYAQTTFRSGVNAIRVDAAVTRGGQPVRNLSASDFVVTDNGVVQQVESVDVEALPLSILLVIDTSDSVAGEKLTSLIDAANTLVAALSPSDRVALITFAEGVTVRVPLGSTLGEIRRALAALSGRGPTALRDAVHIALQLRPDDESRPLVLVVSDGEDTCSWLTERDTLESARRAGVVVHAVSLNQRVPDIGLPGQLQSQREPEGSRFLRRLVSAAGGRIWEAASPRDLRPMFIRALDEMRARYLLTFYAEATTRDGWHELKVSLKNGRADITARPGYFR